MDEQNKIERRASAFALHSMCANACGAMRPEHRHLCSVACVFIVSLFGCAFRSVLTPRSLYNCPDAPYWLNASLAGAEVAWMPRRTTSPWSSRALMPGERLATDPNYPIRPASLLCSLVSAPSVQWVPEWRSNDALSAAYAVEHMNFNESTGVVTAHMPPCDVDMELRITCLITIELCSIEFRPKANATLCRLRGIQHDMPLTTAADDKGLLRSSPVYDTLTLLLLFSVFISGTLLIVPLAIILEVLTLAIFAMLYTFIMRHFDENE
jgi:hypothetical protein